MINEFKRLYASLPAYRLGNLLIFNPKVPINTKKDNANLEHHVYYHSTFTVFLNKLGINDSGVSEALGLFFNTSCGLETGYAYNPLTKKVEFSEELCNPNYLAASALAVDTLSDDARNEITKEKFELMLFNIIENDYSIKRDINNFYPVYHIPNFSIHLLSALSLRINKSKNFRNEFFKLLKRDFLFFNLKFENICEFISFYLLSKHTKNHKFLNFLFKTVFRLNVLLSFRFKNNYFIKSLYNEIFNLKHKNVDGIFSELLEKSKELDKKNKSGLPILLEAAYVDAEKLRGYLK